MSVAAIVLAAGRGTRFAGGPKMLAQLDGQPLVRHAVEAAMEGGAEPVIVVTGFAAEAVETALAGLPVTIVRNADHAGGLSTSLRAGFAALPSSAAAAAILLGDMPRVSPALVRRLLAAWHGAGRPAALVPTLDGRRGNPAVLSRALAPEIADLHGDSGAGRLLRDRDDVVELEVEDATVAEDVDTEAALARLAAQASTTPCRIAE